MDSFGALLLAFYVISSLHMLQEDEEDGRLDLVYAEPVTRRAWLQPVVVLSAVLVVAVAVAGAAAMWVGTLFGSTSVSFTDNLVGMLNVLPIAALALGLAVLVYGLRPGWVVPVSGGAVVVTFVISFLGAALHLPDWVLGLSPFHHLSLAPAEPVAWVSTVVMVGIAAAFAVAGTRRLRPPRSRLGQQPASVRRSRKARAPVTRGLPLGRPVGEAPVGRDDLHLDVGRRVFVEQLDDAVVGGVAALAAGVADVDPVVVALRQVGLGDVEHEDQLGRPCRGGSTGVGPAVVGRRRAGPATNRPASSPSRCCRRRRCVSPRAARIVPRKRLYRRVMSADDPVEDFKEDPETWVLDQELNIAAEVYSPESKSIFAADLDDEALVERFRTLLGFDVMWEPPGGEDVDDDDDEGEGAEPVKKLADYGLDDHPDGDPERVKISWTVAFLDDCDECEDPRVELTVEEAGHPGAGLVGHLSPSTARRLRAALATALREIGEPVD